MRAIFLTLKSLFLGLLLLFTIAIGSVAVAIASLWPKLPSLEAILDYRPKIPLRVYDQDQELIGEFGEERRTFIPIGQFPEVLKKAVLAAEDSKFYSHHGVDWEGVLRAALANLKARKIREGASTITMQVARNFYLSKEKTFARKFREVLLAIKIEKTLSKDQILELYMNQIYLGNRSYGFAAAANIYFGKDVRDLTLSEAALLAGLPQAPSRYNPYNDEARSIWRQHYVLQRMKELGFIDDTDYVTALNAPLHFVRLERQKPLFSAPYVAEMARNFVCARYPDDCYTAGYKVFTTIDRDHQQAAQKALQEGLEIYDNRHGYRGPEKNLDLPENVSELQKALSREPVFGRLVPAVVLQASDTGIEVFDRYGKRYFLKRDDLAIARNWLKKHYFRQGDLIRLAFRADKPILAQVPEVEGAIVALNPKNGAILALVGGYDFYRNKFNHAYQAWRQPGSSFKPFIYSAALEKGFTPASLINDAPLTINLPNATEEWAPSNYGGTYSGPIRMRTALTLSRNLASVRLLQTIDPRYGRQFALRFGFSADKIPPYLSIALGTGLVTPLQMAAGYAVFANGGYRVLPFFIDHIENWQGQEIAKARPVIAGVNAERVLDPRNAFIMTSMMQDVIQRGTAARARSLNRRDLAGKTGTTNDYVDAWFAGYCQNLVAVTWVGFDQPHSLGQGETGSRAALPIWMSYMAKVLPSIPEEPYPVPPGIVTRVIDPQTGALADNGIVEYFYEEHQPAAEAPTAPLDPEITEELF
jgi:penicillin-binding protein 1A